jgi:hypothetical protein
LLSEVNYLEARKNPDQRCPLMINLEYI